MVLANFLTHYFLTIYYCSISDLSRPIPISYFIKKQNINISFTFITAWYHGLYMQHVAFDFVRKHLESWQLILTIAVKWFPDMIWPTASSKTAVSLSNWGQISDERGWY